VKIKISGVGETEPARLRRAKAKTFYFKFFEDDI
jgi:hypothetical protein